MMDEQRSALMERLRTWLCVHTRAHDRPPPPSPLPLLLLLLLQMPLMLIWMSVMAIPMIMSLTRTRTRTWMITEITMAMEGINVFPQPRICMSGTHQGDCNVKRSACLLARCTPPRPPFALREVLERFGVDRNF